MGVQPDTRHLGHDQLDELARQLGAAARRGQELLEDRPGVGHRDADERLLVVVAEGQAVPGEEGGLADRPAPLGIEQEPVAVEDDGRRKHGAGEYANA